MYGPERVPFDPSWESDCPLFMENLPENCEDNPALAALQNMQYEVRVRTRVHPHLHTHARACPPKHTHIHALTTNTNVTCLCVNMMAHTSARIIHTCVGRAMFIWYYALCVALC